MKAIEHPAEGVKVISGNEETPAEAQERHDEAESQLEPVEVETTEEKTKPGYKTSEFWLTLVTMVGAFVKPDLPWEAVATVIGYVLSRGIAKHGSNRIKKTTKK